MGGAPPPQTPGCGTRVGVARAACHVSPARGGSDPRVYLAACDLKLKQGWRQTLGFKTFLRLLLFFIVVSVSEAERNGVSVSCL